MIDLPLAAGLVAVAGDEGTGKTRCLRELAGVPARDGVTRAEP
jgi:ABC-type sulfate/molybdate transport systems ATPase subunit